MMGSPCLLIDFSCMLAICFLCVFAASASLCAFFVSHRRLNLARTVLFVSYLCEETWLFFGSYSAIDFPRPIEGNLEVQAAPFMVIEFCISLAVTVSAAWCISEQFRQKPRKRALGSTIALTLCQVVALLLSPDSYWYQLFLYGGRELFFAALLCWNALGNSSPLPQQNRTDQLSRHSARFRAYAIGGSAVLLLAFVEDLLTLFSYTKLLPFGLPKAIAILLDRNLFEMLFIAFYAAASIKNGVQLFALRFAEPDENTADEQTDRYELALARYCQAYNITASERRVLAYALAGNSIQEIANELVVSVGTVKSHLSHIYHKTNVSGREELKRAFWSHF